MNPINSSATNGQQVGVSPSNPINDPDFNSRQGSNTFDLPYQNLLTCRYGEITPFFYMTGIGRDRIRLQSSHDLRTYTLSSPLMSRLRMKKSFYSVPMKAIMPNSWNYLFVNPVKGNDVPADSYSWFNLVYFIDSLAHAYSLESSTNALKFMIFTTLYRILSRGGLLDYLGVTASALCTDTFRYSVGGVPVSDLSLDRLFDAIVDDLSSDSANTWTISHTYSFTDHTNGVGYSRINTISNVSTKSEVRQFFDFYFEHSNDAVTFTTVADGNALGRMFAGFDYAINNLKSIVSRTSFAFNLYKVAAYQMVVSQFYTNDHVDDVYTSDLWMSNQMSIYRQSVLDGSETISSSEDSWAFKLNGVTVYYDFLSEHCLKNLMDIIGSEFAGSTPEVKAFALNFFNNLFTFRKSLRYGDYFCSARPQPLAVGDVSVPVTGANVSVVDINKNLHIQRFLNAVNRVGSNMVDYAKGIFGYTPKAVDPAPNFISSEYLNVGADEIDNTAADQGTVNTNLVAQDSHFAFDVNLTDDSVILGLISFECIGAYPNTVERDNFHHDRYDAFNPFLQHIGDQDVKSIELGILPSRSSYNSFGYQVRYAEYKFRYNQMHGGFTDVSLRSWAMPAVLNGDILSSDSIRSYPAEFDRFYKSLTYGSLANYFHFQISFQNSVTANRAMDYQPTLL